MIFYPEGVEKNERGAYRSMWHELQSLRNYQFYKGGLNKEEFHKTYCPGCVPRGKNCTHMGHKCSLLGEGLVRFCFQCEKYPCKDLRALDKRYREKYHMSMLENLEEIGIKGCRCFYRTRI